MSALIISGLRICGWVLFSASLYFLHCLSWTFLPCEDGRGWDVAPRGRPGLLRGAEREASRGSPAQQSDCVRVVRWAVPWSSVGPQRVCSSYCPKRLKVIRFRFGGMTLPPAQGRLCVNSRSPFLKRSYCHLLAKLYNDDIDLFFFFLLINVFIRIILKNFNFLLVIIMIQNMPE